MNVAVIMPDMGENIGHGVVTRVEVTTGDQVEIGQPLIEVESDKVILEVPAEHSGEITEIVIKEGDVIKPGEQFAIIATQDSEIVSELQQLEVVSSPAEAVAPDRGTGTHQRQEQLQTEPSEKGHVYAGPSARRLARELGVQLAQVHGTAAQGRITVNDIKAVIRTQRNMKTPNMLNLPVFSTDLPLSREPLKDISKAAAETVVNGSYEVHHSWLQIRADVTQLENIRKHQSSLNDKNHKLGLTAYLLKILALTLKKFPRFNARYDEDTEKLVLKNEIHLGLTVDTPRGLLVPVIKNTDQLTLCQLTEQLKTIVASTEANQLEPAQLGDSSMTLSNLDSMGIDNFYPLLNWPEMAILGTGAITLEPVWHEDHYIPCSIITLALGFDHRMINSADGARFLNHLKKLLENPFLAALQ